MQKLLRNAATAAFALVFALVTAFALLVGSPAVSLATDSGGDQGGGSTPHRLLPFTGDTDGYLRYTALAVIAALSLILACAARFRVKA